MVSTAPSRKQCIWSKQGVYVVSARHDQEGAPQVGSSSPRPEHAHTHRPPPVALWPNSGGPPEKSGRPPSKIGRPEGRPAVSERAATIAEGPPTQGSHPQSEGGRHRRHRRAAAREKSKSAGVKTRAMARASARDREGRSAYCVPYRFRQLCSIEILGLPARQRLEPKAHGVGPDLNAIREGDHMVCPVRKTDQGASICLPGLLPVAANGE